MRRISLLLSALVLMTSASIGWAQPDQVEPKKGEAAKEDKKAPLTDRQGALKVGDHAPDFTLKDMAGKTSTSLAELKGKSVVLYFGSCT